MDTYGYSSHADKKFSWFFVLLFVAGIIALGLYLLLPHLQASVEVSVGPKTFQARLANTEEQREKGLSGTEPLADDSALLMVFPTSGKWPIWMKNMDYSIDVIWMDDNKIVVATKENLSPDTYPKTFTPTSNARYILEAPSGSIGRYGVKNGMTINFDVKLEDAT